MRAALLIGPLLLAARTLAQTPLPVAELDTTVIRIGQQARLDLSVTYRVDKGSTVRIEWPAVADTLTGKIDVVNDGGVDTVPVDPANDPFLYAQRRSLLVTSFDSGYWAIPPFTFVIDGDTASTQPLLLTVHTVEVDTTQAFRDIKDIYDLPFSWAFWLRENWPYLAGGAALLATAVVLIRQAGRRRRTGPATPHAEPEKPLHVRVLQALEAVERKKLWQQGLVKQHHSEVTDILRGYIEERFNVPALERTTDELLKELSLSAMTAPHREQLGNVLRLADMVKFAKWNPSPTENEQVLAGAIALVRGTAGTTPGPNTPNDAAGS